MTARHVTRVITDVSAAPHKLDMVATAHCVTSGCGLRAPHKVAGAAHAGSARPGSACSREGALRRRSDTDTVESRARSDAVVTRVSDAAPAALSMEWDTPSQDLAALLERAHDIEDAAWAVVDAAYPDHHHLAHEADTWQAAMLEDELAHAHESLAGLNAEAGVEEILEKLDGGLQA